VHSGNIFHDWSMETNAWKILHVANVLDVCTLSLGIRKKQ